MCDQAILEIQNLWVKYGSVTVLEDINLSVCKHDFLGIIGPNGGGKTTLLRSILGLVKPEQGKIKFVGKEPCLQHSPIGYVPQHSLFDQEFPISVLDVVLMGKLASSKMLRNYRNEDINAARSALKSVGMTKYQNRQIGQLSGGQQQRAFVARALVGSPLLLLLDEPMSSVDTTLQEEFYELLAKLKERMAIVIVSHDISAISIYVDKIACLNRRLFYHGDKELTASDLEAAYECPVQMLAHGVPHRVLKKH